MNRNTVHKPFRFPAFLAVLTLMIMACANTPSTPPPPSNYVYVTLSRTKGLANSHFYTKVNFSSDYITDPVWAIEGLPAGLTFNERNLAIEGEGPGPGIWNFKISVYDRTKGIPSEPAPQTPAGSRVNYWNFEIRFFTELTEE